MYLLFCTVQVIAFPGCVACIRDSVMQCSWSRICPGREVQQHSNPHCFRFLVICVTVGCEPTNRLWYLDLHGLRHTRGALDFSAHDRQKGAQAVPLPLVKLIDDFDAQWEVLANEGTSFTLLTNLRAPLYRCLPPQHDRVRCRR